MIFLARRRWKSAYEFRRSVGEDGFTLIEALVAFVILSLVMLVLQRGVVGSVDASVRARDRQEAGLIARTLLSSATIAQTGRAASGRMNGYEWRVRFESVGLSAGAVGQTGKTIFQPMRMIVDVRMSDQRNSILTVEQIQSIPIAAAP